MEPIYTSYVVFYYYTYMTPDGWFAAVKYDSTELGPYDNEDTAEYQAKLYIGELLDQEVV